MTIKDIAKIANVSPSTVSKIVNGKHDNISDETRERVLKIVKEYNYAPYAHTLATTTSKTFLFGILLRADRENIPMVKGIILAARKNGYGTIVCVSHNEEDELKNITMLLAHRVDGIFWDRISDSDDVEKKISHREIPCFTINIDCPASSKNLTIDYTKAGFSAAKVLTEAKHQQIICLTPSGGKEVDAFKHGFRNCLYEQSIHTSDNSYVTWQPDSYIDSLLLNNTGFVCYDAAIASEVYRIAERKNYKIPRNISVVALNHGETLDRYMPSLTTVQLPYLEFGEHCCASMVGILENKKHDKKFTTEYKILQNGSVDVPITIRNKRIVVVGALNMDTLINLNTFPALGETTAAKSYTIMPGGKGANQAIGAAKLGAEVCLIGRRGMDYQGDTLMNALLDHKIDVSCVKTDQDTATGHAYIYVQENGESSIVIYEGANSFLTPADIEQAKDCFLNTSFCLLQTEIQMATVEYAAHTARSHGAKVLLKPAATTEISDTLLRNVNIFQPNQNELERLCLGDAPLEQKAQSFLDRGVETVIVTLGKNGCYLRDSEHSIYFPAADFKAVDTTGAADAFSSALAVCLSEGRDIVTAIRYANSAAGFSITRQGVPSALVDKNTLELYMSGQSNNF